MKQSTFFKALGALLLAGVLSGCNQDPLVGKSGSSQSTNTSLANCNQFTIYGATTAKFQAKLRYPKFADDGVPLDQRLLMQVGRIDSSWWNWSAPIRTQFYRRNGKTGTTDTTPLNIIYYYKGPSAAFPSGNPNGVLVNGTYNYFSNEILKNIQTQLGLDQPPTDLSQIDVLIDGVTSYSFGTRVPYQILSIRFDSTQNNMEYANMLIPQFYADPLMFQQTHRVEDGYALADEMYNIHPFKDLAGQSRDFAALASQFCF